MKLCEAQPVAMLTPFVECFWYVETNKEETKLQPDAILPNGSLNLIFNLSGNTHCEYTSETCQQFQELKTRWLSGLRDSSIVVGPTVSTRVVGIRFKPAGLTPFMNIPSSEIINMTVNPDDLWGNEISEIHERLFTLQSIKDQFQLLEHWLIKQFHLHHEDEGLLRSLAILDHFSGHISIKQLSESADLSLRQYRRRFENTVGISPKKLARILRFKKLIHRIQPCDNAVNWSRLALDCGYYDQAHLINDFREFANVTPTQYLARQPVVPGFLPIDP